MKRLTELYMCKGVISKQSFEDDLFPTVYRYLFLIYNSQTGMKMGKEFTMLLIGEKTTYFCSLHFYKL